MSIILLSPWLTYDQCTTMLRVSRIYYSWGDDERYLFDRSLFFFYYYFPTLSTGWWHARQRFALETKPISFVRVYYTYQLPHAAPPPPSVSFIGLNNILTATECEEKSNK